MPITLYQSTDPSAPVISGTAGSFAAALQAILVTGYGDKPGAGWTMPFVAGTVSVFRQGAGNMRYLRVDDTAALSARLVAYEEMTAVSTGTGGFPTNAQMVGGYYAHKSITANTIARPWVVVADELNIFLFLVRDLTSIPAGSSSYTTMLFFGELESPLPGDTFNTLLIAQTDTNPSSTSGGEASQPVGYYHAPATMSANHVMPRSYGGISSSIYVGKRSNDPWRQSGSGAAGVAFPSPWGGGLQISRIGVYETSGAPRGILPIFWNVGHAFANFSNFDSVLGTGALAGKKFLIFRNSVAGFAVEVPNA